MRSTTPLLFSFLVTIFSVGPGHTQASTKPAAKKRVLADLVSVALNEGHLTYTVKSVAKSLGLPKAKTPVKAIRYSSKVSPDGYMHMMKVVFRKDKKGRLEATSLLWARVKLTKRKKGRHLRSTDFRSSIKGVLLHAFSSRGMVGKIKHKKLSVKSRRTKKAFRKELDFWLKDMAHVDYEK